MRSFLALQLLAIAICVSHVYAECDDDGSWLTNIGCKISKGASDLSEAAKPLADKIGNTVTEKYDEIKVKLSDVYAECDDESWVKNIGCKISKGASDLSEAAKPLADKIGNTVTEKYDEIKVKLNDVYSECDDESWVKNIGCKISKGASDLSEAAKPLADKIGNTVTEKYDEIKVKLNDVYSECDDESWVKNIGCKISKGASDLSEAAKPLADKIASTTKDFGNTVAAKYDEIKVKLTDDNNSQAKGSAASCQKGEVLDHTGHCRK